MAPVIGVAVCGTSPYQFGAWSKIGVDRRLVLIGLKILVIGWLATVGMFCSWFERSILPSPMAFVYCPGN